MSDCVCVPASLSLVKSVLVALVYSPQTLLSALLTSICFLPSPPFLSFFTSIFPLGCCVSPPPPPFAGCPVTALKRLPFMRNRPKEKDKVKAIYRRSMCKISGSLVLPPSPPCGLCLPPTPPPFISCFYAQSFSLLNVDLSLAHSYAPH